MPDTSIGHFILHASLTVQCVMLLLLLASVLSWTLIIEKRRQLNQSIRRTQQAEKQLWSAASLSAYYQELQHQATDGIETLFVAAFESFQSNQHHRVDLILSQIQRSMQIQSAKLIQRLERHLDVLATIGSTSPYVGLFGTVWGIMSTFRALGAATQANIATVAPGIAEALVATAMGLFAAIPAVIAYNLLTQKLSLIEKKSHTFEDEIIHLFEKQLHERKQAEE